MHAAPGRQKYEDCAHSDAGAGDRPGTATPHSVSHATGSESGRGDGTGHRESRPARPMLSADQVRSSTVKMVQFMQRANLQIDRSIDRGNLAMVLLFREALRSLERFSEADEIRQ